jgi:acyl-CoA synthetase (AMP-forming)/AMP-acid ligase II
VPVDVALSGVGELKFHCVSVAAEAAIEVVASSAALSTWAREAMANFKVPRHFRIVEVLPTNASGKVVKVELREMGRAEMAKLESGNGA